MVSVTISVSDSVYAWLADKANSSNRSVQALIEDQIRKLPQGDADNPEFLAVLNASMEANRSLLKRLAE